MQREQEIREHMRSVLKAHDYEFVLLLVTDIMAEGSQFICEGNRRIVNRVFGIECTGWAVRGCRASSPVKSRSPPKSSASFAAVTRGRRVRPPSSRRFGVRGLAAASRGKGRSLCAMRLRAIRHAGSAGLSASSRRRARAAAPSGRSGARSSSCCSTCPIGRTSWTRRSSSAAAPPPLVQVLRRGYDRGVSQSRRAAVLREEPDRMRVSLRRAHGAVSGGRSPVRAHGARRQAPRCDRVSFGQARENARSPSLSSRRVPLRPASSHEVDEVAVKIGGGGVFPHVRRERHRYRALELLLGELRQARVPVAEVLPAACRPKTPRRVRGR